MAAQKVGPQRPLNPDKITAKKINVDLSATDHSFRFPRRFRTLKPTYWAVEIMAGSQLKRLKASLKEQGIIGPQQSKKQKRQTFQDQKANPDKRLKKSEALEGIREQFNPFQFKTNARGPKFEVTTLKPANDRAAKGISGRPGLAKAAGEEKRRQTLLVEMQRRNKVGGLIDRRFGENDPNMTLEDKMIERFTREQQRSHKKNTMFDLEEDDEPMEALTHGGKEIFFGDEVDKLRDDFDEDMSSGDDSDDSHAARKKLKRYRMEHGEDGESPEAGGEPERKKTKNEIYTEIIAKSKLHKYVCALRPVSPSPILTHR